VIAQPTYDLGRISADIIMRRIKGDDSCFETIVLPTELKIRESVRKL